MRLLGEAQLVNDAAVAYRRTVCGNMRRDCIWREQASGAGNRRFMASAIPRTSKN
jgi:hypothetical protein